jgi:glutamate/tyrosine decarboxylase-like PLP-dependent enzyme
MVATLHGQGKTLDNSELCGTVTSGGSESIMLAMKTYRDKALQERGITKPEMITPASAHVAFDKAAQYFNIKQIKIPLNANFTVNPADVENAITKNTVAIVGSAPCFPHGIIDPIPELSAIALKHNIGFHTDACLGGFVIPFAEKLGYKVPVIDFRLTGVTSMSIDTHKYGYAAKGTSVLLYRNEDLRHIQYYTATEWPGGLYFSPTLAGSRPGALSATCWAAMLSLGEEGYLKATKAILETATKIKEGMASIPELQIIGDPLWIIAFQSNSLNVYEVLDQMGKRKWNLNGLHKPSAVHIALTLRHTQPGIAEKFLSDLRESVEIVKANPGAKDGLAPVYGLGATLPFRGMVSDILKKTLDVVYQV